MVRRRGLALITILTTMLVLMSATSVGAGLRRHQSLTFETNRGQADEAVRFLTRGAGYSAQFTASDMVLTLGDRGRHTAVIRLKPLGANRAARLVGDDTRRIRPNARAIGPVSPPGATTYGGIRYVDVYPGIDLVYYGRRQRLEYDFVVAPGADPDRIVLAFEGADRLTVDAAGTLVAHTAAGRLRQPRPMVYQEISGVRHFVEGGYLVDGAGRVRFLLAAYDHTRPLVIDPLIDYATYLGGTFDDADEPFEGIEGVGVDGAGNFYVTGTTQSADFPTTVGADRTLDGSRDIFVTKFSPAGAILYSTYLGGGCDDAARDIAVDEAGNAYLTGRFNGGSCYAEIAGALVVKLDPTGAVVYAAVLGGSLADSSVGHGISVDAAGHVYVTGITSSASHDFPTTPGAYRTRECDNELRFANDGFVAKLSADGGTLLYSTVLCGSGDDSPAGIAVDTAGSAYVAGTTASSDFPTVNPFQATRGGGPVGLTGFVSKLMPDGSQLAYSTYLGGSGSQAIGGIAVDEQGNAYVTGVTASSDFPTTPGVLQEYAGNRLCIVGCTDAFVTKLDPSGSNLVYSTYLFGELDDAGSRIAVDGAGNAHVVGTTNSSYFPIVDAFQASNRGLDDAFVAKLDPNGARLVYSSYLGGSHAGPSPRTGVDKGSSLALDPTGNAYVVGYTQSYDFPTTTSAFQSALGAGICDVLGTPCGDAFVVKVSAGGPGVVPPVRLTVTPAAAAPGGTVTATWVGIPLPTTEDHLRLYALGSPDGYPGEILAWWPTTGTAAGQLLLTLPDGLSAGWYELRLYSPDPNFSNLPMVVARSEPIRIDGTATPEPPTKTATPTVSTTTTPTAMSTQSTPTTGITAPPTPTPSIAATPTPTPASTPANVRAALNCRAAIAAAGSALVQSEIKALGTCEGRVVSGKLPRGTMCRSEPKTAAAIARARAKLVASVAKVCGGKDKTCGAGSDDVPLTDAGWDIGACPGIAGGSCAHIITDCAGVAACVRCIGEAAIDQAIALLYDALVLTDPRDKAEKARNKCQVTLGHAATKFLAAESKALTKCWLMVGSGKATGSCPEADGGVVGAIAKAASQEVSAICKVCGGADKACGGGDDLTPAELGLVSQCPSIQPPGDARSCAHAVASLQDAVDCVDCNIEFAVECAGSATVPGLTNYPLECTGQGPTPLP